METFTWTRPSPADPYTDIRVSQFDPLRISDEIRYDVQFIDAKTYTRSVRFEAANDGTDPMLVLDHIQLSTLIDQLSGQLIERTSLGVLWFAVAKDFDNTDGLMLGPLYATDSNPVQIFQGQLPGFRLTLTRDFRVVPVAISRVTVPGFVLHQNYPNPFNPSTTIALQLPNPGHCRLLVYNLLGEEVALLHDGLLPSGEHSFIFDGGGLPSGTYSYQLITEAGTLTRSMLLLR
ncbi:MAG: T9SS type A sorting domain-containing protein [Proteobacteria bacterium]|nr:T9SS type A sorting domain-containing protein [Pseudomonadota bacterium]